MKVFIALLLLAGSIGWAVYEYNNPYGSYQKYFDYGMDSYNDEYYESAIDYFYEALSEKPKDGLTCFYIGLCYIEIYEYELANSYFDMAIDYEPALQEKYDKSGLEKYRDYTYDDYLNEDLEKEYEEPDISDIDVSEIYDLGFTDPKDYNDLGLTEYNDKNYASAMEYFKKAVELDDEYIYSLYNIGLCLYYLDSLEEAVEQYTRCIEVDPTYSNAVFERAFVYYELKRYTSAYYDYTDYIALEPDDYLGYKNRGLANLKMKNTSGACADWEKANELGGDASSFIEKYCN